jgi:hypothetical protein
VIPSFPVAPNVGCVLFLHRIIILADFLLQKLSRKLKKNGHHQKQFFQVLPFLDEGRCTQGKKSPFCLTWVNGKNLNNVLPLPLTSTYRDWVFGAPLNLSFPFLLVFS